MNALILPHVVGFNAANQGTAAKYANLARLCGLSPTPRALSFGLNRLRAQLQLPQKISACGVESRTLKADGDAIAAAALADLCAPANPRPVTAEDIKGLLKELA